MSGAREIPPHSPERRVIAGQGTREEIWRVSPAVRGLSPVTTADWARDFRRIWLIAPHPDDEVLALGGSMAALTAAGAELHILSVTDGEGSHGASAVWSPARLAATRPAEMRRSLDVLGIEADVARLGLPDGRVGAHRRELLEALVERVEEDDLILATCRFDGHPDHEACGDVAALAAELTGATFYEYPVWMWHWAEPDEVVVPWNRGHRILIPAETVERKREAIRAFVSQIEPDGANGPILPPHVLPRFLRPYEVVFT